MGAIRLNWLNGQYDQNTGYGRYGYHLIRALVSLGVDVYPGLIGDAEAPPLLQQLRGLYWDRLTIQCTSAHRYASVPGRVWGYTMFEDSSVPDGWAGKINQVCERLIVPCEHNAESFKRKGVKIPISVVHGGTDPEEFPVIAPVKRERPYTFIALAHEGTRKGIQIVWSAFYDAFPTEDVRLIVKAREEWMPGMSFEDRRVSRWSGDVLRMSDVFLHADCVVYPAFGEGWGMWPREAAMSGLPVIATKWSGLEVGIEHWAYPIEKYNMQRSQMGTPDGEWAVPEVAEVARLMRQCYENQDAARVFGQRAAAWLRCNQTWTHSARQLIELIEKHG